MTETGDEPGGGVGDGLVAPVRNAIVATVPSTPAAISPRAMATSAARLRARGLAAPAATATVGAAANLALAESRAIANSPALQKRSSGFLDMPLAMTCATRGGKSGRRSVTSGGEA